MGTADQSPYDVRFDWGMSGLAALRDCRTFIIVDVLSFDAVAATHHRRRRGFQRPANKPINPTHFAASRRDSRAGYRRRLTVFNPIGQTVESRCLPSSVTSRWFDRTRPESHS